MLTVMKVITVQCAKNLTLGNDTEEDIDVTCLDDAEDNFDPGKMTPGKVRLAQILTMKTNHI
jgi:hypothetical protein